MAGDSWTGSGCVWREGGAETGAGASEGAPRQCKKDLRPGVPLHALVAITALCHAAEVVLLHTHINQSMAVSASCAVHTRTVTVPCSTIQMNQCGSSGVVAPEIKHVGLHFTFPFGDSASIATLFTSLSSPIVITLCQNSIHLFLAFHFKRSNPISICRDVLGCNLPTPRDIL